MAWVPATQDTPGAFANWNGEGHDWYVDDSLVSAGNMPTLQQYDSDSGYVTAANPNYLAPDQAQPSPAVPATGGPWGGRQSPYEMLAQVLGLTPEQSQQWAADYVASTGIQDYYNNADNHAQLVQALAAAYGVSGDPAVDQLANASSSSFQGWRDQQGMLDRLSSGMNLTKKLISGIGIALLPLGVGAAMQGIGAGAALGGTSAGIGVADAAAAMGGGLESVGGLGSIGQASLAGTQMPGMLQGLVGAWDSMPAWQRQLAQQSLKLGGQAATGEDIDPVRAAFGLAGPVAGGVAEGYGALGGAADAPYGDIGYGEDWGAMPGGYAPVYGGDVLRLDSLGSNPAFMSSMMPAAPDPTALYGADPYNPVANVSALDAYLSSLGDFTSAMPAAPDPVALYGPNPNAPVVAGAMPAAPDPAALYGEDPNNPVAAEAPAEDAPLSKLPAKNILSLAAKLLPFLAGDREAAAAVKDAQRAVERQYADEGQRQQAYLQYASELLSFLPEIGEAFDMDAAELEGAFGEAYVNPETGEVGYRMNEQSQKLFDKLMDAADNAISEMLGTDVDKLTADEFNKAIESLQGKRDKDLAKLTRVLYARGMLGLITYGEAFENPFTGETESYDLAEGQGANPYFASTFAGWERENTQLANKARDDADEYLANLLNHSGGMLGMARDQDDIMLAALGGLGARQDDEGEAKQRKLRGLYDVLAGPGGSNLSRLQGMLPTGKASAALADVDAAESTRRRAIMAAMLRAMEDQGE